MNTRIRSLMLAVASLAGIGAAEAAVQVNAASSSTTLIGSIVAGQSYTVTASGVIDIFDARDLTFTADGLPTYAFTGEYAFFSPNGSDSDLTGSGYGPGGAGRRLASLLGTFTASPSAPADYFTIGLGTSFTAAASGSLYALVNDSVYGDNAGSFSVNLSLASPPAAPEPASWALMIGGFGAVGAGMRRRRAVAAAA